MRIILSPKIIVPTEQGEDLPPHIDGDIITYRGLGYDFTPLTDGASIVPGGPFLGDVTRANGTIICTLEYLYSIKTADDIQSRNWETFTFDVTGGQCPCPIKRKTVVEVTDE